MLVEIVRAQGSPRSKDHPVVGGDIETEHWFLQSRGALAVNFLDVMSGSGKTPKSGQATKARQSRQAKQSLATRNESEESQEANEMMQTQSQLHSTTLLPVQRLRCLLSDGSLAHGPSANGHDLTAGALPVVLTPPDWS